MTRHGPKHAGYPHMHHRVYMTQFKKRRLACSSTRRLRNTQKHSKSKRDSRWSRAAGGGGRRLPSVLWPKAKG